MMDFLPRARAICLAGLAACAVGCMPETLPGAASGAPEVASVPPAAAPPQEQVPPPDAAASIEGRWRIVSIDGKPSAPTREPETAAFLNFSPYTFGGTVGCNSFGGLGLLADGHYAVHSWSSTLVGCDDERGRQERALSALMFARPKVTAPGEGRLRLEGGGHLVEIERTAPSGQSPYGSVPDLAGTRWRIVMMDGQEASSNPAGRFLRFGGDGTWQGIASCATLSGTWRRGGERIAVGEQIATTEQLCRPDHARIDASFAALMRANPRYVVGPNGELLLAGGGHAMAGDRAD
jgi:heat shock protein HslJ